MDRRTVDAYERSPAAFAEEWLNQPPPEDLHALVREFFGPGWCADVGCGSGRDTAWLVEQGYPAIGYDASDGLLSEARRGHPGIDFEIGQLPDLAEVGERTFTNVLCETVIMHLAAGAVAASVRRLLELLEPGGTLYLSWRVTSGSDHRDDYGRLYSAFDASLVTGALAAATILHDEERTSISSGRTVHRVLARTAS